MGTDLLSNVLRFLLLAFEFLVIGRVLMSYIDPSGRSGISQFLASLTEPVLAPIRRFLPQAGMFDLSPLIVILVVGAIVQALP